jgi:hypothetical protein
MTTISSFIMQECDNLNRNYENYLQHPAHQTNGKREFLLKKMKKTDVSYSNINRSEMNNRDTDEFFKNVDLRRKQSSEILQPSHRSLNTIKSSGNLKNQESRSVTPADSRQLSRRQSSRHLNNPTLDVDLDFSRNKSNPNYLTDMQADKEHRELKLKLKPKQQADYSINRNRDEMSQNTTERQFDKSNLYNIEDLNGYKNKGKSNQVNNNDASPNKRMGNDKFMPDINKVSIDLKSSMRINPSQSKTTANLRTYDADLTKELNTIGKEDYNVLKKSILKDKLKEGNKEKKLDNLWGGIRAIDQNQHDDERKQVLKMYNE